MRQRLDQAMVNQGLVKTRSQAVSYIRLGKVTLNGQVIEKPGQMIGGSDKIKLTAEEQYVSRAALKLASVSKELNLNFKDKVVLDVGSSTGGFTEYALRQGAKKVIAVDVGTEQLHPRLRGHPRIELHEKTDIRQVRLQRTGVRSEENGESRKGNNKKLLIPNSTLLASVPDIVLIDVSFISLREILPHVQTLCNPGTLVVAMVKPQFEAGRHQINKGVIKNNSIRRQILKDFEKWVKDLFVIIDKSDSKVSGAKGNTERFYLLSPEKLDFINKIKDNRFTTNKNKK